MIFIWKRLSQCLHLWRFCWKYFILIMWIVTNFTSTKDYSWLWSNKYQNGEILVVNYHSLKLSGHLIPATSNFWEKNFFFVSYFFPKRQISSFKVWQKPFFALCFFHFGYIVFCFCFFLWCFCFIIRPIFLPFHQFVILNFKNRKKNWWHILPTTFSPFKVCFCEKSAQRNTEATVCRWSVN